MKANRGAPGVDGKTIDQTFAFLLEHKDEVIGKIMKGKYTPSPVRRKEIPKPDGGVRKLGIPTVLDRVIQQAFTQVLTPIFEPTFISTSYGYRPGKSAQDAIRRVSEFGDEGYTYAISLDLSKYFDTLNHELLLRLLRKHVTDERVVQMVKRYLKAGVMNGDVREETEEGSPQGGNLSPLLANIYLNEFDQEYLKRGVPIVRYADDIVMLARSERAAVRLMEGAIRYLENTLKLRVNREKSRITRLTSPRDFKFLGFAIGRRKGKHYVRIHPKSLARVKADLRELTSRGNVHNLQCTLKRVKRKMQGWLAYYSIARIATHVKSINGWLRRRIRMRIWQQWKRVRTRMRKLIKFGFTREKAYIAANSRRSAWFMAHGYTLSRALTNQWLENQGYYDLERGFGEMTYNIIMRDVYK